MIRSPGAGRIWITGVGMALEPRDAASAACEQAGLERDGSAPWSIGDLSGIGTLAQAMVRVREGSERFALAGGVGARSVAFVLESEGAAAQRQAVPLAGVLAVRSGWDRSIAVDGGDADVDPVDAARVLRQALGEARRKAANLDVVLYGSEGLPAGAAERALRRALGHLADQVPIEGLLAPDPYAGAGIVAEALRRITDGAALVAAQLFSAQGMTVALVLERAR